MDAAKKFYKNTGILLFLVLALVSAMPAVAQQLQLSATSVTLNQSTTFGSVNVTSSGAAITYSAAISGLSAGGGNGLWLRLTTPSTQTTPDSVGVQINNTSGMLGGTYNATVTLTPTAGSPITFTVTWLNGSGGGGGGGGTNSIADSKTTSTMAVVPGGVVFDNVTISSPSLTDVFITAAPSSSTCGGNWLSVLLNTSTVNTGVSATLNIRGDATGIGVNATCTGTVTVTPTVGNAVSITVTLTVGSGGGGGGGGTLSVSPSTFNLNYNTGGVFPSQTLTLTSSSGATFITASSNATWLLINNVSSLNFTPGTTLTASLSSVATGLSTGSYPGTITFTDSLNNTALVNVTLVINSGSSAGLTVSPTALTFNATAGGAAQANTLTVTSTTGGTFTAGTSVSSGVNWLFAQVNTNSLASNTAGSVTVTVNPANLANNTTYTGTVTVTVGSQAQAITVTLNVGTGGGGGGTGTSSVAPSNITLSWQAGTDPGFINRPEITITGTSGSWTSSVSTAQGGSWLSLSPSSGSILPAQATVVVNPTGLTSGNYTGTITVTTPSGAQTVSVTLSVSAGAILNSRPGSLVFNYQSGQGVPAGQSVFFSTSDVALNSTLDITGGVTSSVPWITVTTFTKSIQVSVDPTGLAGGVYTGNVTVSTSSLGSSILPVVLVVNGGTGGGGSGPLTFTPSSLSFAAAAGNNPLSQTLSVNANVQTSFTVSSNQTWLTVSPSSGSAPTNLSVSVNSSGLPAGTYNGLLTFNSGGTVQTLGVSLTVSTTGGGGGGGASGNVTVSTSSINFSAQAPSGTLPVQALTVNSASGTPGVGFVLQVTTTSGGAWLSTSPGPGVQLTTSTTVSVNANATGLAAGTYQGNIRVTPTGGTIVDVPVTLTVTAPPAVSATPTNLTFTYRAGGAAPAAQSIAVAGGGAALTFSATASSTGNWLSVTPTSGTTPMNISAAVNASALSAGTYLGTITVAGTGTATGTTTVNVTLTVTVPLPTINRVTNAASYVSGNVAPGEIITLFGTDMGPAALAGLALDSSGKVATTLAGVQVTVRGYPAPLIYVSNTQIAAVVPYELAQFTTGDVLVKYLGQSSNGISVNVSTTAPGLFTANASGTGPGAILNQNGSVNSPSTPATRGDTIVVYLTGEGQTSPAGVTGKVTTVSATPPLTPAPLLPVSVLIGGQPANFSFAGEAPGFVSGVMQLNVTVPAAAASGAQSIVVSIGGNSSQSGVTVSIQ